MHQARWTARVIYTLKDKIALQEVGLSIVTVYLKFTAGKQQFLLHRVQEHEKLCSDCGRH